MPSRTSCRVVTSNLSCSSYSSDLSWCSPALVGLKELESFVRLIHPFCALLVSMTSLLIR
uniref:Uncharacterized protein n=1 Tax=Megaselia scalaris TaxID=36166 RepID=T1GK51_MEGSC